MKTKKRSSKTYAIALYATTNCRFLGFYTDKFTTESTWDTGGAVTEDINEATQYKYRTDAEAMMNKLPCRYISRIAEISMAYEI